jgi:predicted N-formylglutamate amidohydrolase
MFSRHAHTDDDPVVSVSNIDGQYPALVVCEHASDYIPTAFDGLGLSKEARTSHIAWDPGAREVSSYLSAALDAPLVTSEISRLVYDCNRAPDAPDAMPAKSEIFDVPGNQDIDQKERSARIEQYYRPFEGSVKQALSQLGNEAALITIHSFTPVYHGKRRAVELGVLHDTDTRFADAILKFAPALTNLKTMRNEPYGVEDGVTHTLKLHGVGNGVLNVMIEIRNDLISDSEQCRTMAEMLRGLLFEAHRSCVSPGHSKAIKP